MEDPALFENNFENLEFEVGPNNPIAEQNIQPGNLGPPPLIDQAMLQNPLLEQNQLLVAAEGVNNHQNLLFEEDAPAVAEAVNLIINVIQPPQVFIPVFIPVPIVLPPPVEVEIPAPLPVLPRRHYVFRAIDMTTRLTGAISFGRGALAVGGAVGHRFSDGVIAISARGSRYQRPIIKATVVIAKKVVSTANNGNSNSGGSDFVGYVFIILDRFSDLSLKNKMMIIIGIVFLVFMTFLLLKKVLRCYQNYVNKHKNNWVFKVYPLYKKVALRYQILIALHNTYVALFLHYSIIGHLKLFITMVFFHVVCWFYTTYCLKKIASDALEDEGILIKNKFVILINDPFFRACCHLLVFVAYKKP